MFRVLHVFELLIFLVNSLSMVHHFGSFHVIWSQMLLHLRRQKTIFINSTFPPDFCTLFPYLREAKTRPLECIPSQKGSTIPSKFTIITNQGNHIGLLYVLQYGLKYHVFSCGRYCLATFLNLCILSMMYIFLNYFWWFSN